MRVPRSPIKRRIMIKRDKIRYLTRSDERDTQGTRHREAHPAHWHWKEYHSAREGPGRGGGSDARFNGRYGTIGGKKRETGAAANEPGPDLPRGALRPATAGESVQMRRLSS